MAVDFGHSLELVDGDLVLEDGALAEIAGLANLRQALTLRVLTPLRSDPFNVAYGLDMHSVFIQPAGTALVRDLISLQLVKTLSDDPRVREVQEVQFQEPPDQARRLWPVEVTVLTADGRAQPLQLDVGV